MAKKLWSGRFEGQLDEDAKALSYSIPIDSFLVFYDIDVNRAHVKALNQAKLLSDTEATTLINCLDELETKFNEDVNFGIDSDDEDIHSTIERLVTESCGELGKKMHMGKSRNDQVITDLRLYIKDVLYLLIEALQNLIETLVDLAEEHIDVIFPGMTHFQPAQPVLFSHHLLAYAEKFNRDLNRFYITFTITDVCPLGSGALGGINYPIDREFVAEELGFAEITTNSIDAVSDRDFLLDFYHACNNCMLHLSRFCEEIVVWNSPLLGFVNISDGFSTGSSIMPQKKNPDIAELIRGKFGQIQAQYIALQTTIKGLPLTYNRDLQEDKQHLTQTVASVELSIICFTKMIQEMTLNTVNITNALDVGYLNATELADYLVKKDIPFREAHEITGQVVRHAISKNKKLESLPLKEFKTFSPLITKDIFDALKIDAAIAAKNVIGGTAKNQVMNQIEELKEKMTWKEA